jgi:hypothetical protein
MRIWRAGLSLLGLVAMTVEASAEAVCDKGSSAALKTAAIQQELMVAGFACGASASYNRFVLAYQPELQKSDAQLMAYFRNRDGSEAGYDSYKTKVANLASSRSSADTPRYCAATARDFANAGLEGQTLKDFVAAEHLLIAAPESCAVKYDILEEAVEGVPEFSLPATPYGAPQPAPRTRMAADPDRRQAYNDVPPPPRYQGQYSRGQYAEDPNAQDQYGRGQHSQSPYGGYYSPYGWVPPAPPRRWTWYGNAYDD